LGAEEEAVEEEEGGVVETDGVDAVVGTLYLTHLFEFVGLRGADQLADGFEVVFIGLYLFGYLREEYWTLYCHNFLEHCK
jgi:hypothetical protein